jgi:hypothetical protein
MGVKQLLSDKMKERIKYYLNGKKEEELIHEYLKTHKLDYSLSETEMFNKYEDYLTKELLVEEIDGLWYHIEDVLFVIEGRVNNLTDF